MNKLSLESDAFLRSSAVASGFLNANIHLREVSAYYLYNERFVGFNDLGLNEKGYTSFIPSVKLNVEDAWQRIVHSSEYDTYFAKVVKFDNFEERHAWGQLFWMVRGLCHKDIIARNVTPEIINHIRNKKKEFESFRKCPSSPKLAKLIGFLFGEKAGGAMDWLTTKCPREDKAGKLDEYRIFISVLPHNVAGMSYYSSKNHGGSSWQGHNGTSCQDPSRTHRHDLINHLPASLSENTLAIAWLAKRENNDIWHPVYEARANIRLIPCKNKNLFLICSAYFTNPTASSILIEGLKNQYPEMMIYAPDVQVYGVDVMDIEVTIDSVEYEGQNVCECYACSGTGEVEIDCPSCNGLGDECRECEECGGYGSVCSEDGEEKDTCSYCHGEGEFNTECGDCGGNRYFQVECSSCDGTGYQTEFDDIYLPYIDDTHVILCESEMIIYTLPIDLLIEMGAIDVECEELEEYEA
ncbi:hypothetical protein SECTIM467_175 [Brevibacillus phage SecTim467]|uniref:Uncharacterized protein n=2 Tax=Jenstvirus jenst TaxID=1982225 RepID=A0A0K2CNZ1_9CAUD|nr:hypothetical protein AVV11_gp021 [Brevibacillus phage Jenst]ALA07299.1 hypothetical protein JENST_170 [Brevibacillus phage Jenst]ALA07496.1 hypothetical protein SECTIM467_175 [Brevibacillus phage SecTim467]